MTITEKTDRTPLMHVRIKNPCSMRTAFSMYQKLVKHLEEAYGNQYVIIFSPKDELDISSDDNNVVQLIINEEEDVTRLLKALKDESWRNKEETKNDTP